MTTARPLDPAKLLGFKLQARTAGTLGQCIATGAKIGKPDASPVGGVTIGAKIGKGGGGSPL